MKKIILLTFALTILSCGNGYNTKKPTLQEVRYFTRNSKKIGSIIKKDIVNKKAVVLCYPTYVKESYQLIKYLSFILNKYEFDGVYLPGAPEINENTDILASIKTQSPMLGSEEFIDLYNFLKKENIKLLNTLQPTDKKILILAPEKEYNRVRTNTLRNINKKDVIFVVLAGTDITRSVFNIIKEVPGGKKVMSLPLKNSVHYNISTEFDLLMVMGHPSEYSPIKPIELYTMDNYLTAPESYIKDKKSFIKSVHLNRMNTTLPKLINKSKRRLKIKETEGIEK